MPWTFRQSSGEIVAPDGQIVGSAYSGHGAGLDNPSEEMVPNEGPIPAGGWKIGAAFTHPKCGPVAMRLTPLGETNTFGRDGFLIHGDNASMDHSASHGCIVVARAVREQIAASDDRLLDVVP